MATQTGGFIRDQNQNVHYNGKANDSKAPNKGILGGRKALNDLTNSAKPTLHASKKVLNGNGKALRDVMNSGKPLFIENEASKSKSSAATKVEEKVRNGGRKALKDLTNSGKPSLVVHQAAPKKCTTAVEDKILASDAIVGEQFLHDHRECVKAQMKVMDMDLDMDYFLKMIGLDNNDFPTQFAPLSISEAPQNLKHGSPMKYMEVEEVFELSMGNKSPLSEHKSPLPCKTPYVVHWKDFEAPSFVLIESP